MKLDHFKLCKRNCKKMFLANYTHNLRKLKMRLMCTPGKKPPEFKITVNARNKEKSAVLLLLRFTEI